jgi:hypothetical protein
MAKRIPLWVFLAMAFTAAINLYSCAYFVPSDPSAHFSRGVVSAVGD